MAFHEEGEEVAEFGQCEGVGESCGHEGDLADLLVLDLALIEADLLAVCTEVDFGVAPSS